MIIVMSICIWRGCRWRAGGWARGRGNGRGKRIRARGQRVYPRQRRSGGWAGGDRRRATAAGGGIGRRPGQWRAYRRRAGGWARGRAQPARLLPPEAAVRRRGYRDFRDHFIDGCKNDFQSHLIQHFEPRSDAPEKYYLTRRCWAAAPGSQNEFDE